MTGGQVILDLLLGPISLQERALLWSRSWFEELQRLVPIN